MIRPVQEIGIGSIHDQGLKIMLSDIMRVGFLNGEQVIVRNALFVGPVAFPDIGLQSVYRCMQIDKDIRLQQLLEQDLKEPLVEAEFIFRQVDLGEEQAFGKQIIGDGQALEEVFLTDEFLLLLEAFCHEKEFQRKGILPRILVEFGQKGIVGKLFEDQSRPEMIRQNMRKRGLSRPDISFDCNEIVLHTGRQT